MTEAARTAAHKLNAALSQAKAKLKTLFQSSSTLQEIHTLIQSSNAEAPLQGLEDIGPDTPLLALSFPTDGAVNINALLQVIFDCRLGLFAPAFEILVNGELESAAAGYDTSHDKSYLSKLFLETATQDQIVTVLLRQIGRAADARIATPGDSSNPENAIFCVLIQRALLSPFEPKSWNMVNDRQTIVVVGESITVETTRLTSRMSLQSPIEPSQNSEALNPDFNHPPDTLASAVSNVKIYVNTLLTTPNPSKTNVLPHLAHRSGHLLHSPG